MRDDRVARLTRARSWASKFVHVHRPHTLIVGRVQHLSTGLAHRAAGMMQDGS